MKEDKNIEKEWLFKSTIEAFGTYNDQVMVFEYDHMDEEDHSPVVNISVMAYDDVYELLFHRACADKRGWGSYEETVYKDIVMNIYIYVGSGENRKLRLTLEINDGESRCDNFVVRLSKSERKVIEELAEAYCHACEGKSVDEILRECEENEETA